MGVFCVGSFVVLLLLRDRLTLCLVHMTHVVNNLFTEQLFVHTWTQRSYNKVFYWDHRIYDTRHWSQEPLQVIIVNNDRFVYIYIYIDIGVHGWVMSMLFSWLGDSPLYTDIIYIYIYIYMSVLGFSPIGQSQRYLIIRVLNRRDVLAIM